MAVYALFQEYHLHVCQEGRMPRAKVSLLFLFIYYLWDPSVKNFPQKAEDCFLHLLDLTPFVTDS